jgi:hypothetical protein
MKLVADVKRLNSNWKKASDDKLKNAAKALNRGALAIHATIIRSFVDTKSGNEYDRGGKVHVASAPGEAPARDTGHLGQSTTFKLAPVDNNPEKIASVVVRASYAFALEFGRVDGTIKARPFVRPAWMLHEAKIRADVKAALS